MADSFLKRLRGLMFKAELKESQALIFFNAPSMHTFFMRFPIDIIFLDKDRRVIKKYLALKPFRIANCFSSAITIELPAYRSTKVSLDLGDVLEFVA